MPKRIKKKRSDHVSVTVSLPDEVHFVLKQYAKEDIRSVSQEARYLIELGMQVLQQQSEACGVEEEIEERAPAIGFHVDRDAEDEYEDDD